MNTNILHVEFDVPASVVRQADLQTDLLSDNFKQMTALFLYEHGKLSLGKACKLCGISQWDFFELNKAYGIKLNYSNEDLESDSARLENV